MEKPLKCFMMFNLKEMALRKVAVIVWSHPDVLAAISKFQLLGFNTRGEKEWRESVEDKVKYKMSRLHLPESLKKEVIDRVEPIGIEVRKWKARQQEYFDELFEENCLPDSAKLCFTTLGMIDYVRTAKELIFLDVFLDVQRYRIACLYCLEEYIPLLWEELSEYWKQEFSNDKDLPLSLPSCWPHILSGELHKLDYLLNTTTKNLMSFNQYAFEHSVETGNRVAAEYFFNKLTFVERESSLVRSTRAMLKDPYEDFFLSKRLSDLLCYLLSIMTPMQQMEIIQAHPSEVLLCFLDFPLQDLFSVNAGLIFMFLSPNHYPNLLQKMAIRFSYPGHYVPKLFQKFFIQSPTGLKKVFVDEDFTVPVISFMSVFLESEDSESITVMFKNLEPEDRLKLVLNHSILELFFDFLAKDRWDRVEVCLLDVPLSKEDKVRLKQTVIEVMCLWRKPPMDWGNLSWKKFRKFIDV